MAAAFQSRDRRQTYLANRDRFRRKELELLAGHRGLDPTHSLVFLADCKTGSTQGCTWGCEIPDHGLDRAGPRQDSVRRDLRPLSFQQGAEACRWIGSLRMR